MSNDSELLAAIRLKAYFLWEQAGRPSEGDLAFWDEARRQIEVEHRSSTAGSVNPPGGQR